MRLERRDSASRRSWPSPPLGTTSQSGHDCEHRGRRAPRSREDITVLIGTSCLFGKGWALDMWGQLVPPDLGVRGSGVSSNSLREVFGEASGRRFRVVLESFSRRDKGPTDANGASGTRGVRRGLRTRRRTSPLARGIQSRGKSSPSAGGFRTRGVGTPTPPTSRSIPVS